VVSSQTSIGLAGLVGIKLLTGVLSPRNFGELSLALTVSILFQHLATAPVCATIRRFYAASAGTDAAIVIRNIAWFSVRKIIEWVTILVAGVALFSTFIFDFRISALIALTGLFAICSMTTECFHAFQVAARNRLITTTLGSLNHWLRFLFAAFAAGYANESQASIFALVGMCAAALGMMMLYHIFDSKLFKSFPPCTRNNWTESWRIDMLAYARPLSYAGACNCLQLLSPRWILTTVSGTSSVGLYSVCYQIGHYPIRLLFMALTEYIMPIYFTEAGNARNRKKLVTLNGKILLTTTAVAFVSINLYIITLYFHQPIFRLLTSEYYIKASYLLPIVTASTGISCVAESLACSFLTSKSPQKLTVIRASVAFISVLLYVVGSTMAGLPGLLYADLVQAILFLLLMCFVYHLHINKV
jgi:O-antigen/teichoic acid export membrane protein